MTETLFVYGSLMDPAVQMRLVNRTIPGVPDTVRGFRRYAMLEYPFVLPDEQSHVEGHILIITPEELAALDEYEGDTYLRIRVTLVSGIEAWIYQGDPVFYGKFVGG